MPEKTITDNLVIKGNNYLALQTLKSEFVNKIKLIYIDPPYNTGGDANTFKYNNTYNHSSWLTFMKDRVEIAKNLLKENGTLCISIDDEEYAHLKLTCDEVFGRENYIGTIIVQSNPRGRTINSHFATCHEYALFYSKNPLQIEINNQPLTAAQESDFNLTDKIGMYRLLPFRRSGGTSTPSERPNSEFTLYFSPIDNRIIAVGGERDPNFKDFYHPKEILYLDEHKTMQKAEPREFLENNKDLIPILPIDVDGKRRVWRWSDRESILKASDNNDFNVVISESKYTVQMKDRIKDGRKPKTIWTDSKYDASSSGTLVLKSIFKGEKVFSYPKSIHTVKDIVNMLTQRDEGDIVLDFFAGSGTTAHAVLDLNREDKGNRQFLIIEQLDYIESVTCQRIQRAFSGDRVDNSFIYFELKKYNETFMGQIHEAHDTDTLLNVWEQMKVKSFLNYNVDIKRQDAHIDEFKALSLLEQKRHLCEILDKNQMYVNLSSLNDNDFACSDEEKRLTRGFYQIKGK